MPSDMVKVKLRGVLRAVVDREISMTRARYDELIDPEQTSKEDFDAAMGLLLDGDHASFMAAGAEFDCDEAEIVK